MAVAAWDLINFTDVKDYLGIGVQSADTNQDVWLQEIVSDVSAEIELYCRRKLAIQSVANEIYDGDGSRRLYVNYFPITQLSTATTPSDSDKLAAVQYRDTPDSAWTDIEDDVDHIFFDSKWAYIELYEEAFPCGVQNIRLNYKAGYATIPQDLKNVCIEWVAITWKKSNRSGMGLLGESSKSSSGLGSSVTHSLIDLKPGWEKVLNRYRKI